MLREHNVLRIGDGKVEIKFEVNWNDTEQVKDCQLIRVIVPAGDKERSFVIKKEELNAITFALGSKSEQMKMIPIVESRSRHYETVLGVTATKDIKMGEKIVFPVSIPLPTFEEEIIADAKRDLMKTHTGHTLIGA